MEKSKTETNGNDVRNIQENALKVLNNLNPNNEKFIITDLHGFSIEEVMEWAKKSGYEVKSFNLKNQ